MNNGGRAPAICWKAAGILLLAACMIVCAYEKDDRKPPGLTGGGVATRSAPSEFDCI